MGVRALDFRYYFANTIGFLLSDNEVRLVFGTQEEPGNLETAYEQTGVFMTLRTAKVLSRLLSQGLDHYEQVTGTEIPFDDAKTAEFEALLNSANADSIASQRLSEQSPPDAQETSSRRGPSRPASPAKRRR